MGIVSGRVRKQVYKKCDGRCAYCGNDVVFGAMQVDHLVPTFWKLNDDELEKLNIVRGTDHIENLMPSCKRCNKWKLQASLEVFRAQVMDQPNKLMRDAPGFKLGVDFGFITVQAWDGKFYFEKMPGFSMSHQRVKA